jgi:hypothetical protein
MVTSLCQDAQEPAPNFRVAVPDGAEVNSNLTGRFYPVRPRTPDIKQRLAGQGITPHHFPEYVRDTRFNLRYMKSTSAIVGKFITFRIEKMRFPRLTSSGGQTQVVQTRPTPDEDQHEVWTTRSVQATSAADSSTATMGASVMFVFRVSVIHGTRRRSYTNHQTRKVVLSKQYKTRTMAHSTTVD